VNASLQRHASVIELPAANLAEYRRLHAAVWPGVLAIIRRCHVRNYSIYLRRLPDGRYYLFSYFEYAGTNFAADMAAMAADPVTQAWWQLCKPLQRPLTDRMEGEWWASAEEVFHCD
jgi:L-rhamnose mutarotase